MQLKALVIAILLSVTLTSDILAEEKTSESSDSFLVESLLYIPNRVLDLFDIFRLRIRIGPGFSVGGRATELISGYAGTHGALYAGLPGPRLRKTPKLPIGFESHNGASISIVDVTVDGGIGPDYSATEFGFGTQLGIIGFDFGIDPVEVADLAAGIATYDIRDDDL